MMSPQFDKNAEWLEADGLGGFASGTVSGRRTRRYHALLLAAVTPPTGRFVLANGFDAWVETATGTHPITTQHYAPNFIDSNAEKHIASFEAEPWPRWLFRLEDGTEIEQELFAPHGCPAVALRWRRVAGQGSVRLHLRPFLSGRDYHALHHENGAFRFQAQVKGQHVTWRPYEGVAGTVAFANAEYRQEPLWYRQFLYAEERARGLDAVEDLAAPGVFTWNLDKGEAVLILSAEGQQGTLRCQGLAADHCYQLLRERELQRRRSFATPLHRAADQYLVRRGARGQTIIAGYPWFTDWGRDTFIALRGLCLATGRLDDAQQILLDWAGTVSEGQLPNLFPDRGSMPEYNSVDASLWYIIAVHDYLRAMQTAGRKVSSDTQEALQDAVQAIVAGHAAGTRYGIRMTGDGLLAAGVPGVQLTWMDAKLGDWVVTPRIGKPVEVQALWLNALWIASQFAPKWLPRFERGRRAFGDRFWNEASACLFDVIDVDYVPGRIDAAFRPNQIFAIGGLPLGLLDAAQARQVVDAVEKKLLTPLGLRSLAPDEPAYVAHYQGGVRERDGAYHRGTVWPWLLGPFVEAWVRVRGNTAAAKLEARKRFVQPLLRHLGEAGLGHVSEIADAEPPHTPRGCPLQAWSLGELLRLLYVVLAEGESRSQQPGEKTYAAGKRLVRA